MHTGTLAVAGLAVRDRPPPAEALNVSALQVDGVGKALAWFPLWRQAATQPGPEPEHSAPPEHRPASSGRTYPGSL